MKFKMDEEVIVIGGVHKGKSGTIFLPDGTSRVCLVKIEGNTYHIPVRWLEKK